MWLVSILTGPGRRKDTPSNLISGLTTWRLSFAKGWKAFQSPFTGHKVTQIFVLCVSNAENSPTVMSGLGGSLRLQIFFSRDHSTSNYISLWVKHNFATPRVVLSNAFCYSTASAGEALVHLGKKNNCVTGTFHAVIISKVPGRIHQAALENSVASR